MASYIAIFIVALSLIGFQLNYPIVYLIWGRGETPFGIELFSSLPVAGVGMISLVYMLKRIKMATLLFICFVGWIVISGLLIHDTSLIYLKSPVSLLFIMAGAYYIFSKYWGDISEWLPLIFFGVVASFTIFMLYQVYTGNYRFSLMGTEGIYIKRISIGQTLPTEMTLFVGIQMYYLLYVSRLQYAKYVTLILLLLISGFIIFTGSRGALLCMTVVVALYFYWTPMKKKIFYILMFLCVFFVARFFLEIYLFPLIKLMKIDCERIMLGTDSRLFLYGYLWDLMKENPLCGIGLGEFYRSYYIQVPHQNFLGIGCEHGFPAAIFYIIFIILSLWTMISRNKTDNENFVHKNEAFNASFFFVEMCFLVILYLQLRGLFTDSWKLKELYFLIGAGLGVCNWRKSFLKRKQISVIRQTSKIFSCP